MVILEEVRSIPASMTILSGSGIAKPQRNNMLALSKSISLACALQDEGHAVGLCSALRLKASLTELPMPSVPSCSLKYKSAIVTIYSPNKVQCNLLRSCYGRLLYQLRRPLSPAVENIPYHREPPTTVQPLYHPWTHSLQCL